jgi:antibiotic biosynthesis monooxygenase (ABM) superfamily enzyme
MVVHLVHLVHLAELVAVALIVAVQLMVVAHLAVAPVVTQVQVAIMMVTVLATWVVSPVAGIKVAWLAKRKSLLNVNQTPLVA